jgi:HTH-type transcriptional regulator/antitoxin HigA
MATTVKLKPARKFGPGYFIKEQMEYRQWGQEDLSEVMGITTKHLNKILQDNQPITLDMAKVLSEVFETSPQYWLNLDANYRLWLSGEKSEKEAQAEIKAKIYERMPIRDMIQKKWLPAFSDFQGLYGNVAAFWGVKDLNFEAWDSKLMPLLARKSESFDQYKAAYTYTWYHKATLVAQNYKVEKYNRELLEKIYHKINTYTIAENGINSFIHDLNNAGVVFFVLPHLQKTYLDGAAFFVDHTPVIVYTGR